MRRLCGFLGFLFYAEIDPLRNSKVPGSNSALDGVDGLRDPVVAFLPAMTVRIQTNLKMALIGDCPIHMKNKYKFIYSGLMES